MAKRFQSRKVKILDLFLDPENPRFISLSLEKKDQASLIEYLLENEEVMDLARSISAYGGLMPGELPIIFTEGDKTYVVEGNRRTCACKVLLKPDLAPPEFRAFIPPMTKSLRDSIKTISADVVKSREEAQIVIGTRHITGVKTWPSIAKFMFFAHHYEEGKTVDTIAALTGVNRSIIVTYLKKHYFLKYILSLNCWSDIEKQNVVNYASLHKVGVDKVLRIFHTEGSKELKLSYDDHYRPVSQLPDFDNLVEQVVRTVLGLLKEKKPISTRTRFVDIRDDLVDWLPPTPVEQKTETGDKHEMAPASVPAGTAGENQQPGALTQTQPTGRPESAEAIAKLKTVRSADLYLENLVCNIPPDTNENRAIIALCDEVRKMSKTGVYRQYPLATSYLTRALFEQCCKRYLKIKDNAAYLKIFPSGRDASLTKIVSYLCSNQPLFPDVTYHRIFTGLFGVSGGIKELMDLNMHQPNLSMPTAAMLDGWAAAGLKSLLEYFCA